MRKRLFKSIIVSFALIFSLFIFVGCGNSSKIKGEEISRGEAFVVLNNISNSETLSNQTNFKAKSVIELYTKSNEIESGFEENREINVNSVDGIVSLSGNVYGTTFYKDENSYIQNEQNFSVNNSFKMSKYEEQFYIFNEKNKEKAIISQDEFNKLTKFDLFLNDNVQILTEADFADIDEDKISQQLIKISDEDYSFTFQFSRETPVLENILKENVKIIYEIRQNKIVNCIAKFEIITLTSDRVEKSYFSSGINISIEYSSSLILLPNIDDYTVVETIPYEVVKPSM